MENLPQTQRQLLYLISCALHETAPEDAVLGEIQWSALFSAARAHSVCAMVCMALEPTKTFAQADPEVRKQWLDAKNKAVRRTMLMDADRVILMDEMEKAEIWHMPLKGSILKDWYPQFGMREMGDIDILFDPTRREQVRDIFLSMGYSAERYDIDNHDVYHKPPIYIFEMHVDLFEERVFEDLAKKYENVKEKLLPDQGKPYRFHFTREDFYVFILAHAHKHYSDGGTGIRTLTDLYVMNRKIGQTLNWDYVNQELEELGIRDYETSSRTLAEKIFGTPKPEMEFALTEPEQKMLWYYMESSTYGTLENRITKRLSSMQADGKPISALTKIKYCMRRLFPGRNWCKLPYPFIYRHPCLLPAFWIWRLCRRIAVNSKGILRELFALNRLGKVSEQDKTTESYDMRI